MIPAEIKFDANATPPQWTDDGEQVIEKGTNIRIKIKGLRSEVDKMYAVGTMKEVRRITVSPIGYWLSKASRIISAHCRHRLTNQRPLPTRAIL
jgi:DNA-directed RNA polymerase subunit E'/Rpb7